MLIRLKIGGGRLGSPSDSDGSGKKRISPDEIFHDAEEGGQVPAAESSAPSQEASSAAA